MNDENGGEINIENLPVEIEQEMEVLSPLGITGRDDYIAYLYFIKAMKQGEIGDLFGITDGRVGQICAKYKYDRALVERLGGLWQSDISAELKRKARETLDSIDPDEIPAGQKATSMAILIDKSRLLDDKSTANVVYADLSRELAHMDEEEKKLKKQLGMEEKDDDENT